MNTNKEFYGTFITSLSSNSTTSLVSKLDHLDSMTKNLEQKRHSSRWASDSEVVMAQEELVPLDLAVMEAQSRGSLLDRIASLEARVIKLYLLIESKAESSSTSSELDQTLPDMNSPSESRKGSSYSLSRLRPSCIGNKETSQVYMDKFPVAEQKQEDRKPTNNEGLIGKKSEKCTSKRAPSKAKREGTNSCLHFKLLGC